MIERISLGRWTCRYGKSLDSLSEEVTAHLPSTLQQEGITPLTDERADGYLTDPRAFEGFAVYRTGTELPDTSGKEVFLVLERTRTTSVSINGNNAGTQNSICTPHRYNITEYVKAGRNEIVITVDNISCPVPGGHMTSKDTQTNWLGITGGVYIETRNRLRLENVKIFPNITDSNITVRGTIVGGDSLTLTASVVGYPPKEISLTKDNPEFVYEMPGAVLWSEHTPHCYELEISSGGDTVKVPFGMREYAVKGTDFTVNGEKIFLRGKHDGMIFPMTGAAPTDVESWLRVMGTAKEYGINHYRFHTCCPPEAAFTAADRLGLYLEPELPFWGTVEDEISPGQQYLIEEGFRILDQFGNHPSFFAMSMGNELWGSKERLNAILGDYRAYDPRPLYTQGSNNFQFWPCVLPNEDFFVGVRFSKERLIRGSYAMCDAPLGHIQTDAPGSDYTYDEHIRPRTVDSTDSGGGTVEIQYGTGVKTVSVGDGGEFIPAVPVVSHEVGQYFMYPDFDEIRKYTGVLKPYNLEIFRERLEKAGMLHLADRFFRASGRFAAECYKNEIETALRSKELAGFQLLDIQDFTGQGTALVGVLNSFMENKGVITAVEWRGFCSEKVLLGCLPRFVFAAGERVTIPVKLYHYAPEPVVDPNVTVFFSWGREPDRERNVYPDLVKGSFKGGLFDMGDYAVRMPEVDAPTRVLMGITMGNVTNKYILWVYPEAEYARPENVTLTKDWSTAKAALEAGERVLYLADVPEEHSVEGTYCTDFWNYPMFRSISESMKKPVPVGTLGLLIDNEHPALAKFPSERYSTAQWYDIVTGSRTAILDGTGIEPIVRTIDNCERNHSLGTIFEVKAGTGRLLVCTSDLENGDSLPKKHLLHSLMEYASSEEFKPEQSVDVSVLEGIFGKC